MKNRIVKTEIDPSNLPELQAAASAFHSDFKLEQNAKLQKTEKLSERLARASVGQSEPNRYLPGYAGKSFETLEVVEKKLAEEKKNIEGKRTLQDAACERYAVNPMGFTQISQEVYAEFTNRKARLAEITEEQKAVAVAAYSGGCRTVIPISVGQGSDLCRTPFRFISDSVPG